MILFFFALLGSMSGTEEDGVEYSNNSFQTCFFSELENRLLAKFDAASQRRELSTMAECAKILSQVACKFNTKC